MSTYGHIVKLSKSDIAVLNLLQENASLSRQELADKTGLSSSTLGRRISELEKLGVIQKRVALVDPDRVGLSVLMFVFVNLVSYDKKTRKDFEDFIDQSEHVTECFRVTGGHDYILVVRAKSVSGFEKLLIDQILSHKGVAAASSTLALRQNKHTTCLPLE